MYQNLGLPDCQNLGWKNFLVGKILGLKSFGTKKILGLKKIQGQNIFSKNSGPKKLRSQKFLTC